MLKTNIEGLVLRTAVNVSPVNYNNMNRNWYGWHFYVEEVVWYQILVFTSPLTWYHDNYHFILVPLRHSNSLILSSTSSVTNRRSKVRIHSINNKLLIMPSKNACSKKVDLGLAAVSTSMWSLVKMSFFLYPMNIINTSSVCLIV